MKIGVLRETKNPPDKRVPLSPKQCAQVQDQYPDVELVVQPSPIRKFQDSEYIACGVKLQEDLGDCDILIGVKEVKIDTLLEGKTYLFFSHTFKLQPYNAELLRALLDRKIRLIDYEVIKAPSGRRLIGFGRYAGVVGCYNGFRTFGLKHNLYELKPAHLCEDREEMEGELPKVKLPQDSKFVLTGFGRVGHGAREIMSLLPIKEVEPEAFLAGEFSEPVFVHLDSQQYNARKNDGGFDRKEFYADGTGYESKFPQYCHKADMYIACHYWADGSPFLFTREDMKDARWKTSVVADVSCDIDGPVAATIKPSTIANPIYGYDRFGEKECDYDQEGSIAVMAVDNLPCELPKDASADFGNELIEHVLPHLLGDDSERIIEKASETDLEGNLMPDFAYLEDYASKG